MKTLFTSLLFALIFIFIYNNLGNYFEIDETKTLFSSVILTGFFGFIVLKIMKTVGLIILGLLIINIFNFSEGNYFFEQLNKLKDFFI